MAGAGGIVYSGITSARILINWCALMGVPRVWVSDTAAHFMNGLLTMLVEILGTEHRFSVAI